MTKGVAEVGRQALFFEFPLGAVDVGGRPFVAIANDALKIAATDELDFIEYV
jgi:hypothetical protein